MDSVTVTATTAAAAVSVAASIAVPLTTTSTTSSPCFVVPTARVMFMPKIATTLSMTAGMTEVTPTVLVLMGVLINMSFLG